MRLTGKRLLPAGPNPWAVFFVSSLMTYRFLKARIVLNRTLSSINRVVFFILIQFPPIRYWYGKTVRIPLTVNVLLLAVAVIALVLLFRSFFGPPLETVNMTKYL